MSHPDTLAPFAYLNMPKGNPILSKEHSPRRGLYVDMEPRPHLPSNNSSDSQPW